MRSSSVASLLLVSLAAAPLPAQVHAAFSEDPARRFDFWVGEWDVNLRILQEDLTWQDSIAARAEIYSILDGKAVLELWDSEPIKGFSLRYWDAGREEWVLWLNWPGKNRSGSSSLAGTFRHGRGDFYSTKSDDEGNELISRYSFNDITSESLRWDDAYSKDGGKSWTHNWRMEFSRTAAAPKLPASPVAQTFETGERCDRAEFRTYEHLAGEWQGRMTHPDGSETPASIVGWKILDGCAVLLLLDLEEGPQAHESIGHLTFNTYADKYELLTLNDRPGVPAATLYGDATDDGIELLTPPVEGRPRIKVVLGHAGSEVVLQTFVQQEAGEWASQDRGLFSRAD